MKRLEVAGLERSTVVAPALSLRPTASPRVLPRLPAEDTVAEENTEMAEATEPGNEPSPELPVDVGTQLSTPLEASTLYEAKSATPNEWTVLIVDDNDVNLRVSAECNFHALQMTLTSPSSCSPLSPERIS